jgi:hypothetical protein
MVMSFSEACGNLSYVDPFFLGLCFIFYNLRLFKSEYLAFISRFIFSA